MKIELTSEQQNAQKAFQTFVSQEILPQVKDYDAAGQFPAALVHSLGQAGYLGALIPAEFGGQGMDMITFGLLAEAIGYGCSSARNLFTVHSMACRALLRWGSAKQKARWAPLLADGKHIAAFALTEPEAGSQAGAIETTAVAAGDMYRLNGRKKWITFGQSADFFLLFAKVDDQMTAFWVERESPGLHIEPLPPLSGCRSSMLAELRLEDCRVSAANVIGRPGFGWSMVGNTALDNGRYTVAWGSVGLAQAALDAAWAYAGRRRQFDASLKEHQLIQQMLANMITNIEAARLLCYRAGYLHQQGGPEALLATSMAKYFAANTAVQVTNDAVQIHGARGLSQDYPVERYWRDAKIMEIIEGSTQIQQITIARSYPGSSWELT